MQIMQYLLANTARVTAVDALKISTNEPVSSSDMNLAFVGMDDVEDLACDITPPQTLPSPIYTNQNKHTYPERRPCSSSISFDNTQIGEVSGAATETRCSSMMRLGMMLSLKRHNSTPPDNNAIWCECIFSPNQNSFLVERCNTGCSWI